MIFIRRLSPYICPGELMHSKTVSRRLWKICVSLRKIGVGVDCTLCQDIHRIIDLDVHVVTDSSQLIFLGADDLPILALDFPRGIPLLGKFTRNHDGLSVFLGSEGFFALIFDMDGDFRGAERRLGWYIQQVLTLLHTFGPHE